MLKHLKIDFFILRNTQHIFNSFDPLRSNKPTKKKSCFLIVNNCTGVNGICAQIEHQRKRNELG